MKGLPMVRSIYTPPSISLVLKIIREMKVIVQKTTLNRNTDKL